jgi:hypothetical protein
MKMTRALHAEILLVVGLAAFIAIFGGMYGGRLDLALAAIVLETAYALVRAGHIRRWITGIDETKPPDRFIDLDSPDPLRIIQSRTEPGWLDPSKFWLPDNSAAAIGVGRPPNSKNRTTDERV